MSIGLFICTVILNVNISAVCSEDFAVNRYSYDNVNVHTIVYNSEMWMRETCQDTTPSCDIVLNKTEALRTALGEYHTSIESGQVNEQTAMAKLAVVLEIGSELNALLSMLEKGDIFVDTVLDSTLAPLNKGEGLTIE